ncbi:hypothetical protein Droror1_Dr00021156, partial [Drosera rotundifolia]
RVAAWPGNGGAAVACGRGGADGASAARAVVARAEEAARRWCGRLQAGAGAARAGGGAVARRRQ